ncbi:MULTISPECIES: Na+/H+ antiporter subunit E [unclassified Rhizobium]|uniref:Na+/H+ antiporter subunit E n=1 Tax=unclassified Rhizobium TaxID=2613769 RepID=UPI001618A6F0|nr:MULTISPECIES: Na+/H+ antiporter subunit E [unclassified Rhizobium]MBB3539789.1 multicomponent Na+:H+ antiporter subunit E [Rhizobium sp. BK399]MCS3739202.1 multicomponent Na+:H+ antiporter subunit E [Rhizobium sp. BK661]MCS4090473.1 multicomponent Na+:H+ antiporter subunit E [Rhizobium sp. BK176]
MIALLLNVLLAIAWATVTGSASPHNLLFGFVVAALCLSVVREPYGSRGYLRRSRSIMLLGLLFLKELAISALKVAATVLTPTMRLQPGIFAFPLTVDRDFEITLLANMITLTPGTLSVDVSDDRKTLYVHALDCSDPEGTKRDIANGFERRILEAFR